MQIVAQSMLVATKPNALHKASFERIDSHIDFAFFQLKEEM